MINTLCSLDPDLDATKRIAVLQSRIQELKRTYMQVKTELASVERRRKKLRRKERESKQYSCVVSPSPFILCIFPLFDIICNRICALHQMCDENSGGSINNFFHILLFLTIYLIISGLFAEDAKPELT